MMAVRAITASRSLSGLPKGSFFAAETPTLGGGHTMRFWFDLSQNGLPLAARSHLKVGGWPVFLLLLLASLRSAIAMRRDGQPAGARTRGHYG
jgi:hypothetical protein